MPIAHLYKSQVYAIAEHLGMPEVIRSHPPMTDTYSMPQSPEELYFSLPYDLMDLCLFGKNNSVPVDDIAVATSLTVEQVNRVFRDIDQKRKATEYLHLDPELVGDVPEIPRTLRSAAERRCPFTCPELGQLMAGSGGSQGLPVMAVVMA